MQWILCKLRVLLVNQKSFNMTNVPVAVWFSIIICSNAGCREYENVWLCIRFECCKFTKNMHKALHSSFKWSCRWRFCCCRCWSRRRFTLHFCTFSMNWISLQLSFDIHFAVGGNNGCSRRCRLRTSSSSSSNIQSPSIWKWFPSNSVSIWSSITLWIHFLLYQFRWVGICSMRFDNFHLKCASKIQKKKCSYFVWNGGFQGQKY